MCRPRRGTPRGHASATDLCEGWPEYGGRENSTEASQGEAAFPALSCHTVGLCPHRPGPGPLTRPCWLPAAMRFLLGGGCCDVTLDQYC